MEKYLWGIIIIFVLCLFFVRVPYDTFPDNTPDAVCVNGELKLESTRNMLGDRVMSIVTKLSETSNALGCGIIANGDADVTSQIECVNGQPTVICKTQLYKAILAGQIKFVVKDRIGPISDKISKSKFNIAKYNFTEWIFGPESSDKMNNFCAKEVCLKGQRASGTNNAKLAGYVSCNCVINEGSYAEGTFVFEDIYIDSNSGERITYAEATKRGVEVSERNRAMNIDISNEDEFCKNACGGSYISAFKYNCFIPDSTKYLDKGEPVSLLRCNCNNIKSRSFNLETKEEIFEYVSCEEV